VSNDGFVLRIPGTETAMTDETKDVEEQRAATREQLAQGTALEDEQAADEASLAPPGHLGERMNEAERRERL
jgi:hypothetical protein